MWCQKIVMLIMLTVCVCMGAYAAPLSLYTPEFEPDYVRKPIPVKETPEYRQVDTLYRGTGEWAPEVSWEAVQRETAKVLPPNSDMSACRTAWTADAEVLSKGITECQPDLILSAVSAFGENAFLPLPTKNGAFAGAARFGKGKIVLLPHDTVFQVIATSPDSGMGRFLQNIILWSGTPDSVIGISEKLAGTAHQLSQTGKFRTVKPIRLRDCPKNGIYLMANSRWLKANEVEELRRFVENGGTLVIADTAWHWLGGISVEEYPLHALTRDAGLLYTGGTVACAPPCANPNTWAASNLTYAMNHFSTISTFPQDDQNTICAVLSQSAGLSLPVNEMLTRRAVCAMPLIYMDEANPLDKIKHPLLAMVARMQCEFLKKQPADRVPVHPCARDWPGLVDTAAKRITRELDLHFGTPKAGFGHYESHRHTWRMTGLYAPPGQVVTLTVPSSLVNKNLMLQIGNHVDVNYDWHNEWVRFPDIFCSVPVNGRVTVAASAFGGLISIGIPPGTLNSTARIEISGAVEAPFYVYGKTTTKKWLDSRRSAPGAWGYLETDRVIAFGMREHLMKLDEPDIVSCHWYNVVRLGDLITGMTNRRGRPEMITSERQITVGYGHSGYPAVMCYNKSDILVSPRILKEGDWGFYHELGHSYQFALNRAYTLVDGWEVDVNLVPYIVYERLHGDLHPAFIRYPHGTADGNALKKAWDDYMEVPVEERDFDKTKFGLVQYLFYWELKAAFGWDLFARVMDRVHCDPENTNSPETAGMTREERFMTLLCLESKHNLIPYYTVCGIRPIPESLRKAVVGLPEWNGNQPISVMKNQSVSLTDDAQEGKTVAKFESRSPEPSDSVYYRIVSGNEDGAFGINWQTGNIYVLDLDAQRKQSYNLVIEAFDSSIIPQTTRAHLHVKVTSSTAEPVNVKVLPANLILPDGVATGPGTKIGSVSCRIPQAMNARYQLDDASRVRYSLDPKTGVLTLKSGLPDDVNPYDDIAVSVTLENGKVLSAGTVRVHLRVRPGVKITRTPDGATAPDSVSVQPSFTLPDQHQEHYRARLQSWFQATDRGLYTFGISADDDAELWIAPGHAPDQLRRIAVCPYYAGVGKFTQYGSQCSDSILLKSGEILYMEVRFRQIGGDAHISVCEWHNDVQTSFSNSLRKLNKARLFIFENSSFITTP